MFTTARQTLFALLIAVFLACGITPAAADIAISFTSASDEYHEDGARGNIIGWSFMANTDLVVNKLAVYDTDRDVRPEPAHFIGLWKQDGSLIASVMATEAATPRIGMYHWASISPTLLRAGEIYTVGAVMGSDHYTAYVPESLGFGFGAPKPFGNLQVNPNITFLADAFYYLNDGESYNGIIFGSGSLTTGLNGQETIIGGFGANLDVAPVPIPGAVILFGSGLVGLFGLRSRFGR